MEKTQHRPNSQRHQLKASTPMVDVQGKIYYAAIWDKINLGNRRKIAKHGEWNRLTKREKPKKNWALK
ncbi:hypothetical protein PMIT1342_02110 [Prochlorococcus marinus str. MIT 1342]|nr:hypothetical protein PMIT1342_02110 [Prochlorococcus marinus str. MIT 1342]